MRLLPPSGSSDNPAFTNNSIDCAGHLIIHCGFAHKVIFSSFLTKVGTGCYIMWLAVVGASINGYARDFLSNAYQHTTTPLPELKLLTVRAFNSKVPATLRL